MTPAYDLIAEFKRAIEEGVEILYDADGNPTSVTIDGQRSPSWLAWNEALIDELRAAADEIEAARF